MAPVSPAISGPLSSEAITRKTQECFEELQRLSLQNPKSPPPVLISLGRPGSGRSSSIEDACGSRGYSQWAKDPATQSCELVKVNIADQDCFIMNAPGFHPDHAKPAFQKIVDCIQRLLSISRIAGFLYFTRINPSSESSDEFDQTLLQVVRAMSGDEFIPCLTFVTTFWTAEDPTFQAKFNTQLEERKSDWRENFGNQALHFYQHGRGYNAEGEMTESFINWFDARNEMAQHIRDMILRRFCGESVTTPAKIPAIVHELKRGTPIHETEAGRILWSQSAPSDTGSCSPSDQRRPDSSQGSPPASAPRKEASGPGWTELLGEAIFYGLRAALDSSRGQTPSFGFTVGRGTSSMRDGFGGGMTSTMRSMPGSDPLSSVDVMKLHGLDSSNEGRLRYAAANGITGEPFSAAWGDGIRRHVQGKHGA